jgi:hypothetical protein
METSHFTGFTNYLCWAWYFSAIIQLIFTAAWRRKYPKRSLNAISVDVLLLVPSPWGYFITFCIALSCNQIVLHSIQKLLPIAQLFLCTFVRTVGVPIFAIWILRFLSNFEYSMETIRQVKVGDFSGVWCKFDDNFIAWLKGYIFSFTVLWDWLTGLGLGLLVHLGIRPFLPFKEFEPRFDEVFRMRFLINVGLETSRIGLAAWLAINGGRKVLVVILLRSGSEFVVSLL